MWFVYRYRRFALWVKWRVVGPIIWRISPDLWRSLYASKD